MNIGELKGLLLDLQTEEKELWANLNFNLGRQSAIESLIERLSKQRAERAAERRKKAARQRRKEKSA